MLKKKILVLAPHNDDETIGMGATMARYVREGHDVYLATLTSIADGHPVFKPNRDEIRAETRRAMEILGVKPENVICRDMPNVLVPELPVHEVNGVVYDVVSHVAPDVLYIPFINDLHKDHRDIVYAAQVAARTTTEFGRNIREIYMYETLSETHWNIDGVEGGFLPNVYVDVTEYLDMKLEAIAAYKSQLKLSPNARSVDALRALAVFRGSIAAMNAAEAFMLVRKLD